MLNIDDRSDGALFSLHVNNLKILSREKVTEGVVCGFFFSSFLTYPHLSTHKENRNGFQLLILGGVILSYCFMHDYIFLI